MSTLAVVLLGLLGTFSATVTGLTYPIIDTGVTTCYSDTAVISSPTSGSNYYGQDCTYNGTWQSYQDNGDNQTITDLVTGLMWQKYMDPKMLYSAAPAAALAYRGGGYSDWRLPTIKELYSLILFTGDVSGINAGTNRFINTSYFYQPLGDTTAGERQIDAQTVSGTEYTGQVFGDEDCNFGVNFVDGRIKCYPTTSKWYFRYVRGVSTYGVNSFTKSSDGTTVTDSATGLMWQQGDSGAGKTWKDALAYCEGLTLGGYSDWRLPNAKELQSIVDYTRGPQTTDSPAIDPLFTCTDVTEPDGSTDYGYYWTGSTHLDGGYTQGAYICFGQCWGKPDGVTFEDCHGAGAQRSDPKTAFYGQTYPQYMGPQGDMRTVYNYARCVRNA